MYLHTVSVSDHCICPSFLQSPISHEIMRVVAAHVVSGDKNDILLLDSVSLDDTPFELPPEREVSPETYLPSFVSDGIFILYSLAGE